MTNTLGHKIKKIRELKDLTQEHVAAELGVSQASYSRMEKGEADISVDKAEKISSLFGISLNELMSFDERVVFNIMNSETNFQDSSVLYQHNSDSEVMKEKVASLEKEVAYLKQIIDLMKTDGGKPGEGK